MLEYSGVGLAAETRWDVLYKKTAMTLFFYSCRLTVSFIEHVEVTYTGKVVRVACIKL